MLLSLAQQAVYLGFWFWVGQINQWAITIHTLFASSFGRAMTDHTCNLATPWAQHVTFFSFQANTADELPERLIGAVRVSHLELKSAIVPKLEPDPEP